MKNTSRPLLPARPNTRHTQKRSSGPLWLEAINQTLADRGHNRRLSSITNSVWNRHIEPLIAAVEEGALVKTRKRKRLGYQVVDAEDEMPEGWVSFGIYSLADCRRVIDDDKDRWQLVTIFEGDIEEPSFYEKDQLIKSLSRKLELNAVVLLHQQNIRNKTL